MPLDHELKLDRARQHLDKLQSATALWLADYRCTIRQEYDPDASMASDTYPAAPEGGNYMLGAPVVMPGYTAPSGELEFGRGILGAYIDEVPDKQIPDLFGLLIGDLLHNLRSSLDTLAYALMLAGPNTVTEKMKSGSEFPIFGDEDTAGRAGCGAKMFADAGRKYVNWKPGAQACVEGLQPYKRGQDFRDDPLWILHDLDRINKHRYLHVSTAYGLGALWQPTETRNLRAFGPGMLRSYSGRVESGAPVMRILGIHLADPSQDVYVEVHPAVDVVFSAETPTVGERPVIETVALLYNHVAVEVIPSLSKYL